MKVVRIAAAIGLSAVPAAVGAQDVDKLPSILVSGSGEVETEPDRASISYTLRGEGSTSDDAVRAMVATGEKVEAAIKGLDGGADLRTGSVSSVPVRSTGCQNEDYRSQERLSKGVCAIEGYVATQEITITTARILDAGTMAGLAARYGAEGSLARQFYLSDAAKARAYGAALSAAFRDENKNASALASGSGVQLGPILMATNSSEPEFRSAERDGEITVSGSPVAPAAPPPVTVKVKPEKITTRARVNVRYQIQR